MPKIWDAVMAEEKEAQGVLGFGVWFHDDQGSIRIVSGSQSILLPREHARLLVDAIESQRRQHEARGELESDEP